METQFPQVIDLNVGGCHFTIMLTTLTKYPESMLAAMFSGRQVIPQDKDGRYVIDCDGKVFGHILEFLRFGTLPPSDEAEAVHRYSLYYGPNELSKSLESFQTVKSKIVISNMEQRFPELMKLACSVIDCLTRNAVHKNSTTVVVITQSDKPNYEYYGFRSTIREMLGRLPTLKCLSIEILATELNFGDRIRNDGIFFLTANSLEHLGYGQHVFYLINRTHRLNGGLSNETEIGCFLLDPNQYLSSCVNPPFQRQPSSKTDEYVG
ncbi:uncharacterized protein LOC127856276 [Dreissena polymorpha]|uniref:Potassium channel tetramerisation-type BTB domain-containing protein n=1 Tax=Dreissena polymorpha TaxID=45954 RepID=A0A9D4HJI3_DREPO|nr:uncharacterized protein LOC127856276 [Dreissena polymorpha]KAH3719839.1 hypothetical protein DPMN_062723 [Dreissena polymorpha]